MNAPNPTPPIADSPSVRAFRLLVEYDGTAYAGWQIQPNAPTVQGAIEEALARIARHPVRCVGAGRTDAGVHALGQVARILVDAPNIDAEAVRRGGNTHLPEDIRIVEASECRKDFDPRREAVRRWYRYTIFHRPTAPALGRHRMTHAPHPIDWDVVERALEFLRGHHDFQAFRSSACKASRTELTMEWAAHTDEHPVHHLDFQCRSFLHNMVRLIAGLLIEIGARRHEPEAVREMLEARQRTRRFRTAPPQGLVLMRVDY